MPQGTSSFPLSVENPEANEEGGINESGILLSGNFIPYTHSPMVTACEEGHENVVKVLQTYGIECYCKGSKFGIKFGNKAHDRGRVDYSYDDKYNMKWW